MSGQEKVSVKVKAIHKGYYNDRIINEGEEFTYVGTLSSKGNLPMWVTPLEKFPKVKEQPKKNTSEKINEAVDKVKDAVSNLV